MTMGMNCERMRELLVELTYGELDPLDEDRVEAHLDECDSCARRARAFGAVREDLQAWDAVEPAPSRVTFVPMSSTQAAERPANRGGFGRWLPVAASFALGLLLTAAVASFQAGGTDLSPATGLAGSDPAPATSPLSGTMTPVSSRDATAVPDDELDAWLDRELAARGYTEDARTPVALSRADVEDLMQQRERQLRDVVQQMVAESERRQREQFDAALAGLYQAFDSQRSDDLITLASRLGLLEEATGQELDRTNAAIDYLITQVAAREQQSPERRE